MEVVMTVVAWLVFGLIIGALARFLMPGRQDMSLLMTAALGVVGSFIGGGLAYLIFGSGSGWLQPAGWIMSILGALVTLLIYIRMKAGPNTRTRS